MDENELEKQLTEVARIFNPDITSKDLKGKYISKSVPGSATTNPVLEIIDYLRVCIKYQTFDLESTRRENTYLRKLLDSPKEED